MNNEIVRSLNRTFKALEDFDNPQIQILLNKILADPYLMKDERKFFCLLEVFSNLRTQLKMVEISQRREGFVLWHTADRPAQTIHCLVTLENKSGRRLTSTGTPFASGGWSIDGINHILYAEFKYSTTWKVVAWAYKPQPYEGEEK